MKCAEIHRNDNGVYFYICFDCTKEFSTPNAIIDHIENLHYLHKLNINYFDEYEAKTHTFKLDIKVQGDLNEKPLRTEDKEMAYADDDNETEYLMEYNDEEPLKTEHKEINGDDGAVDDSETEYLEYIDEELQEYANNEVFNNDDTSTAIFISKSLSIDVLSPVPVYIECDICGRLFGKKSQLIAHMKIHSEHSGLHGCEGCDRKFQNKKYLQKHKDQCEIAAMDHVQSYCKYCKKQFRMMCEYKKHFENIHQDNETIECLICGDIRSFSNQIALNRHMQSIHIDRPYECDICHAMIRGKGNLSQHHKTQHTNLRPFQCNVCEKSFKFAHYLRLHMRFHAQEKQYECSLCDRTFYTIAKANEHMKSHTNARQFKCNVCYKKFMTNENLQQHLLRHENEEQHICTKCDKIFSTKKTLKQHMALHSDVKQYQCRYCSLKFAQFAGRRSHENSKHLKEIALEIRRKAKAEI